MTLRTRLFWIPSFINKLFINPIPPLLIFSIHLLVHLLMISILLVFILKPILLPTPKFFLWILHELKPMLSWGLGEHWLHSIDDQLFPTKIWPLVIPYQMLRQNILCIHLPNQFWRDDFFLLLYQLEKFLHQVVWINHREYEHACNWLISLPKRELECLLRNSIYRTQLLVELVRILPYHLIDGQKYPFQYF